MKRLLVITVDALYRVLAVMVTLALIVLMLDVNPTLPRFLVVSGILSAILIMIQPLIEYVILYVGFARFFLSGRIRS